MRNIVWLSDHLALAFTILITTWCSCVLCLETESGSQQQDLMGGNHEPMVSSPLNDRYFRNYYEMLRDVEPVWKRAPASGFMGMRGKKVPSSTFYGMRGKKGPSGFLGMRGKKSQDAIAQQLAFANGPPLMNLMGDGIKLQGPLTSGSGSGLSSSLDSFDDYSLFGATGPSAGLISAYKRVPGDGFIGLRGKRSIGPAFGMPASSYK